jgi:uncharacterized membrane protein YphA (DoxX/SURF4 family)
MGVRDAFAYSTTSMQTNLVYSAPLRFFIAYEWLTAGTEKLQSLASNPAAFIKGMTGAFNGWAAGNPNSAVAGFLKGFVVPNAGAVVWMVAICEFLVGLSFLVGFFVRPAATGGMLMSAFFYLGAGFSSPSTAGINLIMLGSQATMLLISPGRFAGLDYFMHKRFASIPLW